jgi:tetratricopeptide (TPR) repeat protein
MKRPPRFKLHILATLAFAACFGAQAAPTPAEPAAAETSALTAELFYELLLGEINLNSGDPGTAFALILDSARKSGDARLYQRAVEIALKARSGDAALQAARAWKESQPLSRDANRYVLQILLAVNRVGDTLEPLRTDLALVSDVERPLSMAAIPRMYARVTDKKLAASTVEEALKPYLDKPVEGAVAWSTVGRMRLIAQDNSGALEAARNGQDLDPTSSAPAFLALQMMGPQAPLAETIVKKYVAGKPSPEFRVSYARALVEAKRYAEATQQLQILTKESPDFTEGWLLLGALQLQANQAADAETAYQRALTLLQAQPPSEERSRSLVQIYLSLAEVAEKRKDFAGAEKWLARVDDPQALYGAQIRRASLLAKQGQIEQGRKLIQSLPERTSGDARTKLSAEVQLLRDNKQYQQAYDLLAAALVKTPRDTDLMYDQAMIAEKMENPADMERILREVMVIKPEFHHAYNALGYSLADRNVRLPEAKQLIQKALEYAPNDPFISDSLAWVEFRMGNKAEALRILDEAYKSKPDAEIAAHLGEVLWSMGQTERATAIWKEGFLLNPDNETLLETLKRLRVKL